MSESEHLAPCIVAEKNVRGQWIGRFSGQRPGRIVIDMDDKGTAFSGVAYVFPDDPAVPPTIADIQIGDRALSGTISSRLYHLFPHNHDLASPDALKQLLPDWTFPAMATVTYAVNGSVFDVSWTADTGGAGKARLRRKGLGAKSNYKPIRHVRTWEKFKEYVIGLEDGRFIFRGQSTPKKLSTTFHRTNRTNVLEFMLKDIPILHRSLRTKHYFNLMDGLQNGAFYNLLQHHGYPTPLLDWTYSPFVASFFAFRNSHRIGGEEPVRIFVFDKASWCSMYPQFQKIAPAAPHFSVLETVALENERLIPQQALSTITNIEDIEAYIRERELERKFTFLSVIDLPRKERSKAMRELGAMGITAGSLFPGLDGACEALRERHFAT